MEARKSIKFVVKDITGKILKKLISYAIDNVDVSDLAAGTYFITLYSEEKEIGNSKFIKL